MLLAFQIHVIDVPGSISPCARVDFLSRCRIWWRKERNQRKLGTPTKYTVPPSTSGSKTHSANKQIPKTIIQKIEFENVLFGGVCTSLKHTNPMY